MKITIVAGGRFHSIETVRAANDRGWLRSVVADRWRPGMPKGDVAHYLTPLSYARFASRRLPLVGRSSKWSLTWDSAVDRLAAARLPDDMDILHGFAAYSLRCGITAHSRGAKYLLDTGGAHISTQLMLLERAYGEAGLKRPPMDAHWVAQQVEEATVADAIVVGSDFARQSYLDRGFEANRVTTVEYGVEPSVFECDAQVPRKGILYVGNISLMKGFLYLTEMIQLLQLPREDVILVGRVSPECRRLFHSTQHLFTHIPNLDRSRVAERMQRTRCLVLPSVQDGFGMVVTEALACGTPVVLTQNVGASGHIRLGVNGWIVPPFDSASLAAGVELVLGDPEMTTRMRECDCQPQPRTWSDYAEDISRVWSALHRGAGIGE